MSYRPANYAQVQQRYRIIDRGSAWGSIVYSATRSFAPGTKLVAYASSSTGAVATITYQGSGDDLIPSATATAGNIANPAYLSDQSDYTCTYDPGTISANSEDVMITYNLGSSYSGFVRIYAINNFGTSAQIRVYTSPDNTNWSLNIDTGPNTGTFNKASYVSNIQYIQLRVYNNSSSSITPTNVLGVCSLEFYPSTKFRTSLTFPDNTVRNVFIFSTGFTRVIEEVPIS